MKCYLRKSCVLKEKANGQINPKQKEGEWDDRLQRKRPSALLRRKGKENNDRLGFFPAI